MWMTEARRRQLLLTIVVLAHFAVIPGGWLAIKIGRPEFFGLVIYAVVTILIFDIALIASKELLGSSSLSPRFSLLSLLDWRLVVVAYSLSTAIAALYGRGVVFYLLMAGAFLVLVLRIQVTDYTSNPLWFEVALVISGSMLLIAAEVLPAAYYASTSDTIVHTALTTRVLHANGLSGLVGTRYANLPMLHVSGAIGVEVTGLDPRTYLFAFTAILFGAALLASVLFFRNVGATPRLMAVGAILMGVNIYFIEFGTKSHAQSLSFVLFCFLLYLITVRSTSTRYLVPALLLMVSWILTHHFSVVVGMILLTPLVGVALLSSMTSRLPRFDQVIRPRYGLIFSLVFLSYWSVVTFLISVPFQWILLFSPAAEGVETTKSLVTTYSSIDALVAASVPFIIDNLHYAFLLAMTGLGVWYVLTTDRITKPEWKLALVVSPAAAFFYFPNPGWLPLRGAAAILRWGIMTLPLLVLFPAVGVEAVFEKTESTLIRRSVISALVLALLFTAIATGMSAPSLTDLTGYDKEARNRVSHDELAAIEFTRTYTSTTEPISAPVLTKQYLYWYGFAERTGMSQVEYKPPIKTITASGIPGRIQHQPGLTIFPSDMFSDELIRVSVQTEKSQQNPSAGTIVRTVPAPDEQVTWSTADEDLVYSNGATFVQYAPEQGNPSR